MHRTWTALCACALAFAWSGSSQALTFQTSGMYNTQLAAPLFTGVGMLGSSTGGRFQSTCTASLVGRNVILTAAHCSGSAQQFVLPATGLEGGQTMVFSLRDAFTLPSSSGTGMSDMMLMTLDGFAHGREIYELYSDRDELGQVVTMVGAGLSGLLKDGASYATSDFQTRYGVNRYDASGTAIGYNDDILMMDNDDGTAEHDVFGRYLGVKDTGVYKDGQLVDAGLIYGDSGGPDFIGRKLAGVHSFAGSGSFLETPNGDGCARPGSVDPVPKGPFGCSDGSYGDIGGSIRVSSYYTRIRDYITAAAVPEPRTWMMMILGFGMIGTALRRQRRTAAAPA